jgi:SlyX protein
VERLIELETQLMHLQETVQALDGVVLAQQKQLETLEREIKRLNIELGVMREGAIEERSLVDEKPPHY